MGTEKVLGWSVELVEREKEPAPKEVLKSWAQGSSRLKRE